MIISIIAAMAKNKVIGKGNSLPWHLPADLKHFKDLTLGKTIIMGGRTFESIGKALPGRKTIVLTDNKDFSAPNCIIARSIEQALEFAKGDKEIMIAGGASVYKQFLPLAKKMYLTFIDAEVEGDFYFPDYEESEWEEMSRSDFQADKENIYSYSFVELVRRDNKD